MDLIVLSAFNDLETSFGNSKYFIQVVSAKCLCIFTNLSVSKE